MPVADQTLELGEFRVEHDGPEVAFRFETTLERAKSVLASQEVLAGGEHSAGEEPT